jgi:hypothetical protein
MRKCLIIGIDFYQKVKQLHGCANDAYSVKSVLERHSDGSLNFSIQTLIASDQSTKITKRSLKEKVIELFQGRNEISLFYFSGHGFIESTGGFLLTSECERGDDGLSMNELLILANQSKAQNKVIVLDCCHSGAAGSASGSETNANLSEGLTILTASASDQYSIEHGNQGVFTTLFVDALNGSAANLVGDITPGSVYAHIDQSLGPWEQRPLFKTNVRNFISLRKAQPPISLEILRRIVDLFPDPSYRFPLDPSYEPTSEKPIKENTEILSILQKYNRINLVKPYSEEHMYYAAMHSTGCHLTVLGVHYWHLVKKNRI